MEGMGVQVRNMIGREAILGDYQILSIVENSYHVLM
jgi:hypothetical protein